jgi:hypothetical protein
MTAHPGDIFHDMTTSHLLFRPPPHPQHPSHARPFGGATAANLTPRSDSETAPRRVPRRRGGSETDLQRCRGKREGKDGENNDTMEGTAVRR